MPTPPAAPKPGQPDVATALLGDLPCVNCSYNLRGLSVRAVCPECKTAVLATVLAVIDPKAEEFSAIGSPRVVAAGFVVWALRS
ncbi:MAG: hypothetical protein AAF235_10360 [Planctomycetota bacterium]